MVDDPEAPGNSLEEVVDIFVSLLPTQINGAELLTRLNVQTAQGFDAVRTDWKILDGRIRQSYLMVIDDSNRITSLIATVVGASYNDLKDTIDYVLESFMAE